MLGSVTMGSSTKGSLVPSLAGDLSLAGESPLGGVVEADSTSGAVSACS